jgi:ribose transport system substrate-binding protein
MALGAIKAIEAAKRDILVVGFDGTDDAVSAVNEGTLLATVAQQAAKIGSMCVDVAEQIIKGENVADYTPVALKVIKK